MDRTLRKAARRIVIGLAARRAPAGLMAGAAAGGALLLLDRLLGLALPAAAYGSIVAAGVLAAAGTALLRRPGPMEAAVRLDRGLDLQDRLGTAEAARRGAVSGPFAELVRADAERVAHRLDVAAATPIRIGRRWPAGAALAALLAAGFAWLPPLRREPPRERENQEAAAQRAEIAGAIGQAVENVDPGLLDEQSRQDLDALDALARQLAGDEATRRPGEARDESAARMESMADRLEDSAQRNLEAIEDLARRAETFPARSAPEPDGAAAEALDEMIADMRRGDLDQAARRAEEAIAQGRDLPAEERREIADELDSLARHLRRPDADRAEQAAQEERVREALQDLGMDEAAAKEALESRGEGQGDEALPGEGGDVETARELARDIEELDRERRAREAADALRERMAEAIEEAARQVERGGAQPQPDEEEDARERRASEGGGLPQALRELERLRRESTERRALSRSMQEAARRLADSLSEEERERLAERWMQAAGDPKASEAPGAPGASGPRGGARPEGGAGARGNGPGDQPLFEDREDVDLRDPDAPGERSAARWTDPAGEPAAPAPPGAGAIARRAAAQRARTEAEQAVERGAVPPRYHRFIRRYFSKLAEPAPASPDPAAGPGEVRGGQSPSGTVPGTVPAPAPSGSAGAP
jgi:hypothetical protein